MQLAGRPALFLPLSALGRHLWMAAERRAEKSGSLSDMVRGVEQMTGGRITPGSGR